MNLKYVLRFALRQRLDSVIKIVSLMLGLFAGIVLLTQVAFLLSYDDFFPGKDRLFRIERVVNFLDKSSLEDGPVIHAPLPAAMRSDIKGVRYSTVVSSVVENIRIALDQKVMTGKVLKADSGFFDVFGIDLIAGDPKRLASSSQIFISRSFANQFFADQDPVGEVLLYDNKLKVTVAGIFEDLPLNTHLKYDVLLSFQTLISEWDYQPTWTQNDSYWGYVRLDDSVSPKEVEAAIPAILPKYYDVQAFAQAGKDYSYYLKPVDEIYRSLPDVRQKTILFSVLALLVLGISSVNYILISLSALRKRAKSVAVFKGSGASKLRVFLLFVEENALLLLVSLSGSFLLIYMLRGIIDELLPYTMENLFTWRNLNVMTGIVLLLIMISGMIPAWVFSNISVCQLLGGHFTEMRLWKRGLLFVQIACTVGVTCFMVIVYKQYETMSRKNLGYDAEPVLFAQLRVKHQDQFEKLKREFASVPFVRKVSIGTDIPLIPMTGDFILDTSTHEKLFLCRLMGVDSEYFETLGMRSDAGRSISQLESGQVLVNQSFVDQLEKLGLSLRTAIQNVDGPKTIVGVVDDFQLQDANKEREPVMIYPMEPSKGIWWSGRYFLLLNVDNLSSKEYTFLSDKLRSLIPDEEIELKSYWQEWLSSYSDIHQFRKSITVASSLLLAITLLGLICYMKDEIFRKSKRIAISRIHGALDRDIFLLLLRDCLLAILLGAALGAMGAYWTGSDWLGQFAYKMHLEVSLFLVSGLAVLLIVLGCIYLCFYRMASENPIRYIKME